MDFVFDLLQGAGIAAAIGIRPFLPTLLVGALAAGDLGIDFDGTDFSFLEQAPLLAVIVVLLAIAVYVVRRRGPGAMDVPPWVYELGGLSLVLGTLMAAGSMADHGNSIVPGIIVGVLCALLGFVVTRDLLARTRKRLDTEAANALTLYAEGAGLVAAGASVLFPPLAVLVIGGLLALMFGGRRRAGEKYAGLRILR
jgi:Mn2+/Fe2+ NRAMP family transporter